MRVKKASLKNVMDSVRIIAEIAFKPREITRLNYSNEKNKKQDFKIK